MNIEGIVKKSTAVFLALVMVISPIVDAPWSSLFSSSVLAEGIPAQVEHCCSSGVCTDDHSHGGDIEGELVSLSAADLPEVLAAMIEEMEAANSMMNLVPTSDVNFGDLIRAEHSAGFPTRIGGATITPVEQDGNHVVHGNGRLLWELRISFDVAFVDANGNPTPIGVPGNIPGTLEFEFRFALDDPDDLYILGAPTPLPEVRSRDVVYVNVPAHGTFIRVRGVAGGPQGELFNTNFASISQPNANGEVEFSGDLGNAHNSVHAFESFFRVHFTYGLPPGDGSEPKFPQMFCWNCEMTPWGDEYEIKPVTCVTDGIRRTTRTCVHPRLCANVDHVDRYYPLASGHNMQVVSEASPTCTEDGHIRRTCSSCGIEETDIFPALTHIWGNWSETTYVDPNASICVRHGIQTRHCTRDDCNDFETRNIYAAGHSFPPGEYTIVIHATCRQPGLATGRCSVCGDDNPDGVVLPPLGPDWGEWGIPIPATCFTPEYRTRSCIRPNCDCEDAATEREYLLPARAHDWGAWSVELQPGCITPGIEIRHCTHS
ncbi:MAG: hypothetical protein FWF80_04625, partial [Defluviitaleaceae bacterium]|nr:hypothetical protein [Defluviitaleaceae bacterium]